MRVDLHFNGGVPMTDAGSAGPAPTDRCYDNDAVIAGYRNLVAWARTADRLGYHTMWLTEHHFQYQGYEVVPNLIQFGLHLAGGHAPAHRQVAAGRVGGRDPGRGKPFQLGRGHPAEVGQGDVRGQPAPVVEQLQRPSAVAPRGHLPEQREGLPAVAVHPGRADRDLEHPVGGDLLRPNADQRLRDTVGARRRDLRVVAGTAPDEGQPGTELRGCPGDGPGQLDPVPAPGRPGR